MTDEPMVTISVPARYADAAKERLREDGEPPAELWSAAERNRCREFPMSAFNHACAAALLELPDPPKLTVGELAEWGDAAAEVKVCGIDGGEAWVQERRRHHWTALANELTPLGIPAPDDWGQA